MVNFGGYRMVVCIHLLIGGIIKFNILIMQNPMTWLYHKLFFVKNDLVYDSNTKWLINFVSEGKPQSKILTGESQRVVRERFLIFRPNIRIENITLLECL